MKSEIGMWMWHKMSLFLWCSYWLRTETMFDDGMFSYVVSMAEKGESVCNALFTYEHNTRASESVYELYDGVQRYHECYDWERIQILENFTHRFHSTPRRF